MKRWLLVLVWACGDNALPDGEPLAPAPDLVIVAHQDDDLLFMQPALLDEVQAGTGVTIVYVTAGDDGRGLDYAAKRYSGVRAAYTSVVGDAAWSCGWIAIEGHAAEHCRLASANLSLVFLGYPDGGRQGQLPESLVRLWEGTIEGADTIAERTSHYDRGALVTTLSRVIAMTTPRTIRTLEVAATHGDDHADHEIVGALAVVASAGTGISMISSRGYNIASEPANVDPALVPLADAAFAHYAACAEGCAPCGDACPTFSPTYEAYLERSYPIEIDREVTGALAIDGSCATVVGEAIELGDCAEATRWQFANGTMHAADRCAAVAPTGSLAIAPCDVASPIVLDGDGHLWLAEVPAAATATAHLDCIGITEGQPRAMLCGGATAPAWTLVTSAFSSSASSPSSHSSTSSR